LLNPSDFGSLLETIKRPINYMNLTDLVRKLEGQLKSAEKYTKQYDEQAAILRNKLAEVALVVGNKLKTKSKSRGKKGK
jgi:hypothetical protein